jgi:UDP-2,3-diacylglucosamine pyrophosphatase LpxH
MTNIRYICLSDLHLGQNDSLLTHLKQDSSGIDVSVASPTLRALADVLHSVARSNDKDAPPPTLILNGDILETALADMNIAAMTFERFLETVFPASGPGTRAFGAIMYLPGNHDHHFWEMTRESAYVDYIRTLAAHEPIAPPWHATNLFVEKASRQTGSFFLSNIMRRHAQLSDVSLTMAYPNLGLVSNDGKRAIYCHHGHFIESIYCLMTHIADVLFPERQPPCTVWDLEAENFAWIDFFWSTMGRSGNVGPLVERVYNCLGDKDARHKRIRAAVEHAISRIDPPGPDRLYDWAATALAEHMIDTMIRNERQKTGMGPLSVSSAEGLRHYLALYLRAQIDSEMNEQPLDNTFVFGHTHKPYEGVEATAGYGRAIAVYNTGGWVVESTADNRETGASIVLIDSELNTAAIHLYNEGDYLPRVACADDNQDTPLFETAARLIETEPAFEQFSQTVKSEVKRRQDYLALRLAED